ncbi:MAG: SigE family RNA polymerase sigma factor [Acidimicrobiales bacterium]
MDVIRVFREAPLVQSPPGPSLGVPTELGFVELYRDRYDPMVRLAYLLVGHQAIAEELVQDAFVKVHRQWSTVEHPPAYLRTAVVNQCRSWGRRRAREQDHQERRLDLPTESEQAPDELWDVLLALPLRQRTAIVLRFYEDLPEQEIAAVLGSRPTTVRTLIHRGLEALRKEIER